MTTKQIGERFCPNHLERLLLPDDVVCSECKKQAAKGATTMKDAARLDKFLATLESCLGVTIWQDHPAYVYQGTPITLEPCMYEASLLQEALDLGKAEKRVITIGQAYKLSHQIEIVALKKKSS
jgi:hypothetical protein